MDKISKINVNGVDYELAGSEVSATPQKITHASLVELKETDTLVTGTKYRIIDFVTETTWEGEKPANVKESAKHPYDLIVTAKNESSLEKEASAIQHEGDDYFSNSELSKWKLEYSLTSVNYTKGKITKMVDEFNNVANFDFKNLLESLDDLEGSLFYAFSTVEMSDTSVSKVSDATLTGKVLNNYIGYNTVVADIVGMLKLTADINNNNFLGSAKIILKSSILANSLKYNEINASLKIRYTKGDSAGITEISNNRFFSDTEVFAKSANSRIRNSDFRVNEISAFRVSVPALIDNCVFLGKTTTTSPCDVSSELHSNIVAISEDTYKTII